MKAITKVLINSAIAGGLVFFGTLSNEIIEHGFSDIKGLGIGLCLGFSTAVIIFLTKIQTAINTTAKKGAAQIKLFDFV